MKTGLEMRQQKTEPNRTFVTNGYLAWMLVGAQKTVAVPPCMHSGFPAKMGEQMIVTS